MKSLPLLCALLTLSFTASADDLPFGMQTSHLNIVFSVTEADAVHEFYGEILGLKRIPDLNFPGDSYMIRYMGGESELKFIVTGQSLPKHEGGTGKALGIRLLAILLPESESEGILKRLVASGRELPSFTSGKSPVGYGYRYGMAYDGDGNQIEIVFLDDNAPKEKFEQIQIGLTVSDPDAMNAFVGDIIGLGKVGEESLSGGRTLHRYQMGKSQVKFWPGPEGIPAWVGGPSDKIGMNLVQFIVPDVDAVRDAVLKRGGTIAREPFALGGMATIMFVGGPDGILFEFAGPLLERLK